MTADANFTPPRKKHSVLWWVGGVFLLLVVLFLIQLFGPSPRIIVSPQTTYITQPLGANGLPDYERYLLELSREGVTPENNAAPLLWQALFPGELDPKDFAAVAAEFGLGQIPAKEDSLVSLHHATNRQAVVELLRLRAESEDGAGSPDTPADPTSASEESVATTYEGWSAPNSTAVENVLDQLMERPWTSDQLPALGRWVRENKQPLDLLIEASHRPRYYFPSPNLLDNKRNLLIEMLLPHVQSIREVFRSLPARAMWHLGEGRPAEAWQDLLALHRLSHLLTQSHTLIEQFVGIAMSGIACDGTLTLLHQGQLTPDQARQVQRDLAALPNFAAVARTLNEGERTWALDACVQVGSGGGAEMLTALSGGQDDFGSNALNMISVDWNLVMREMNRWYDRLVAAASLQDRANRAAALDKIDMDLRVLVGDLRSPGQMLAGVVSRRQRSELVGGILISLFLPALSVATSAEDRANTTLELTRLAAALAVYRAEHGDYPEKLEDLLPGVLDRLPVDLYKAKPFIYKRHTEGFLLYSAGENGVDDGGSNSQMRTLNGQVMTDLSEAQQNQLAPAIPAGADDVSIRAQRRMFEWPKLAPPAGEP